MALKGVYTALSGAIAQSSKLDTIANNIANVNTPGFKRDELTFHEYVTAQQKEQMAMNVPRIPASIESFYDMQGGDKSYVDLKGTYTDYSQGSLRHTGNNFDVAIDGKGFFEVMTPGGVRLTRAGNFTLDGNGRVVTKDGFPVLQPGADGADPSSRTITVNDSSNIGIGDNGEISQGGEVIGRLSVVQATNPDGLKKVGNSLYGFKDNINAEVTAVANPSLKSGFLETSNVNIVKEMTDMITTQRVFESTQRAISAYDQMSDKLVNIVGKTSP
ncbi:MAG: flagellar basal-body rod protein FlgF [Bdellovibrionaceae bacterium]|nr:flagellar basal-body rod protein FlgF [Pseudobdellovibrionaceae bacterium]MBX3032782.1 flagellar basal-body rod protein FlgF [Pseudobdellovibrionaceae bacterium]